MGWTLKFYTGYYSTDPAGTLKLGVLSGYTFATSDTTWAGISAYHLAATGEYPAAGIALTSSYVAPVLSLTDLTGIDFVTTASVSHLVVYNSTTGKLLFAYELSSPENWNNTIQSFDFSDVTITITSRHKINKSININL